MTRLVRLTDRQWELLRQALGHELDEAHVAFSDGQPYGYLGYIGMDEMTQEQLDALENELNDMLVAVESAEEE